MTLLALLLATALANPLAAALDGDAAAIAALRDQGPSGLEIVLASPDDPRRADLADAVAQQRDASLSGLYWYTDLQEAQQAAEQAGKPIVSLRLLGELTSEYSCANSRLFRTVLYSNPQVSAWLREHVVLHWSTERPAPVATIDFGDGRVMKRTITGNSAHIVLDSSGRPLDVIPGLYSPEGFIAELSAAEKLFTWIEAKPNRRQVLLQDWHRAQLDDTMTAVTAVLANTRGEADPSEVQQLMTGSPATTAAVVPAIIPMEMTVTKMVMERPMLVELDLAGAEVPDAVLQVAPILDPITPAEWDLLAAPHQAELHPATIALVTAENPAAELGPMLAQLGDSIAKDTAHNEAELHARVHQRFSQAPLGDFEQLTTWLYTDIFQTPDTDPWLGMLDANAYTGLTDGGLSTP